MSETEGIKIVKYGTKVLLSEGQIKGIITAVSIRDQWMQYEVSYFSGGNHKSIWTNTGVQENELHLF